MGKCRIFKIIVLICFMFAILSSKVFALGDWLNEAEDFIDDGRNVAIKEHKTLDTDKIEEGSTIIFNAFLAIGTVVAVIVGAILGIQFMTAGIEKKVEVKQALYPYIISCIVMFGAFGIWKLFVIIMNELV